MDTAPRIDASSWVERHGDTLYGYALAKLREPQAAEEAVQETFLAALKHRDHFSGRGSEGAWLMGILKRKVIDHFRRSARGAVNVDSDDNPLAELFDEDGNWAASMHRLTQRRLDSLEAAEFREIFEKCLQHLSPKQASAFLLKEVEESTSREICKLLGITTSNLWVLMHRARLRLAECIRTHWSMGEAENA